MPVRLVHVMVPSSSAESLEDILDDENILDHWYEKAGEENARLVALVKAEHAEDLVDALATKLESVERHHIILIEVAALLPRPEDEGEKGGDEGGGGEGENQKGFRISREELYENISSTITLSVPFAVMMAVSAMVAAVGLSRGSPAMVIAAMVIAPLLGPIMALAFSVNLGDYNLALRALRSWIVAVAVAVTFAIAAGLVTTLDAESSLVRLRTRVSLGDVILALGAGVAGAMAYTSAAAPGIIGVMVAAALLPALVACGMLMMKGMWAEAGGAMLLFITNVICVSLAATTTFFLQGIRPRNWYEADRARQATIAAMVLLGALVAILIASVLVWRYGLPW